MNLLPRWVWARSATTRHTAAEPDPGDMGTAFGLDASIESMTEPRPAPAPVRKARVPWSQRLVRRPQR